jgi:polysaccharide biosynthesis protein PslH
MSGATLRVLHFVPRVPWPLDTGAKLRNYHLARQLARETRIRLLAFADNDTETQENRAAEAPEHFYDRATVVPRDQGYTPAKILRGAFGRAPLPLLNYTTATMKQSLAQILSQEEFDVVQIESIHLLAYLPIIRAARSRPCVILDWHNLESDLMRQYSLRAKGTLRRAYARRTSRQLSRLEWQATKEVDAHVVVSDHDRARLLDYCGDARAFVIENGVDTDYYSDKRIESAYETWVNQQIKTEAKSIAPSEWPKPIAARKSRIVFVASMDYHANSDAALSFAREVWPIVHERRPDLVFTIVGRHPAPEVRQLAMQPGIEVTGTVDDVRPYYHEAVAAIIPLRVGGGSRLKILEAMAAGVPVVSTTLGAEGLEIQDNQNILIANTKAELSEAIVTLCGDSDQQKRLSVAGRALVSARYDWAILGNSLLEIYQRLVQTKPKAPIAE